MKRLWCFKKKEKEEQRDLVANDVLYNKKFKYALNDIKTSRYTWYNFIFKNLFEQFHRVVNVYFVFLLALQFIPQISSLNPYTTLIPIVFVLSITAVKDAVDDFNRHQSDKTVNNRKVSILKDGKLEDQRWMDVKVGDVIKLSNDDHVTADLLLLSSSEDHNLVYIETAELDGETNLKVRQALPITGDMAEDEAQFASFNGAVKCEAPNNHLHKFAGNLYWKNETFPLDNDNVLLRGCAIRNTEWCFGLVIFAGPDTKLMQNTGKSVLKRTSIDRLMNKLVWVIFCFLLLLAFATAIGNGVWENQTGRYFQLFLPWETFAPNPNMSGFLTFWSYIIILNTVVPISLYVSIEFARLGQSLFINWDRKMYYDKKNLPAMARTTTLNEELGQIEYVFSDKTGTLTQNVMEFRKCSIAGSVYGDATCADDSLNTPVVDLSYNDYAEDTFKFYDEKLIGAIQSGDRACSEFFRLIAICHTVMSDLTDEGELTYQAQSPDESALVTAARNFGFVFKSRTFNTITIVEMGKSVEYEVLAILDFDNVRKRMSVIVESPDGDITLYCKGADSVIYERLETVDNEELRRTTTEHLDMFAADGLRTLCLSKKSLDRTSYEVWRKTHTEASTALEDRDDRLSAVYEEIERDMTLLGATAIEDKLQDGVPETIANLVKANIKIWVLTGDKQETAINIGYSCNMLTNDMKNVFVVQGYSPEDVEKEITDAFDEVKTASPLLTADSRSDDDIHVVNHRRIGNGESVSISRASDDKYGLVINGHSLVHALSKQMELKFLDLASLCSAVICCRVTPLQKAKVVELVKTNKKAVTLAIGDGANDVSMIKAAHIGVGISGEEGTQAVLSSDFAFGQFRYLERLLLVHGRWSYVRMCKFFGYFFYKNFAFTLVHFWYSFFNGLTAQSAYDDWFVTLYNIVYTSSPIFMLAILEQDVSDEYCIRFPKLYFPGQKNALFNMKIFCVSLVRGILVSLILFFVPYLAFIDNTSEYGLDSSSLETVSTVISTSLILVVTLQVALETSFWTPINHFFTWGSILVYFLFTFALYSDGLYNIAPTQFPFVGVARTSYQFPNLWFTVLLTSALCILPVVVIRVVRSAFWPTYVQEILKLQNQEKDKRGSRSSKLPDIFSKDTRKKLRERLQPKRRGSRPGSGYAFSHQRGFGDLIVSGRMGSGRRKRQRDAELSIAETSEPTSNSESSHGAKATGSNPEVYRSLQAV